MPWSYKVTALHSATPIIEVQFGNSEVSENLHENKMEINRKLNAAR